MPQRIHCQGNPADQAGHRRRLNVTAASRPLTLVDLLDLVTPNELTYRAVGPLLGVDESARSCGDVQRQGRGCHGRAVACWTRRLIPGLAVDRSGNSPLLSRTLNSSALVYPVARPSAGAGEVLILGHYRKVPARVSTAA